MVLGGVRPILLFLILVAHASRSPRLAQDKKSHISTPSQNQGEDKENKKAVNEKEVEDPNDGDEGDNQGEHQGELLASGLGDLFLMNESVLCSLFFARTARSGIRLS